jgi:hypothetical protein
VLRIHHNEMAPPRRARAARTCASAFLALCIVFLLWLFTAGPGDDDDGAAGSGASSTSSKHDDLLVGVPDDFLHHGHGEGATHAKHTKHGRVVTFHHVILLRTPIDSASMIRVNNLRPGSEQP